MQKTHTSGGENISGWGWRLPSFSVWEFRVAVGWPYGKRPAVQVYSSWWYGGQLCGEYYGWGFCCVVLIWGVVWNDFQYGRR